MEEKTTLVKREKFYQWIKQAYTDNAYLTARECAEILWRDGKIPLPIRQATHPRITEMVAGGVLEIAGTKVDETTRKHVTVYRRAKNECK